MSFGSVRNYTLITFPSYFLRASVALGLTGAFPYHKVLEIFR